MMLQISSAHGPLECQLAVAHALRRLQTEADACRATLTLLEAVPGERDGTFRSVLIELDGEQAASLAARWIGTVQWTCESPYRPRHPRRNWYVGVAPCTVAQALPDGDVRIEAMRARGPGGQHVNKTASAIRATHLASGISVRVESERSQHANRRLAMQLLTWRLQEQVEQRAGRERQDRRMQHFAVERGNPVRVFRGAGFAGEDGTG